jgi:hypothetical protein
MPLEDMGQTPKKKRGANTSPAPIMQAKNNNNYNPRITDGRRAVKKS